MPEAEGRPCSCSVVCSRPESVRGSLVPAQWREQGWMHQSGGRTCGVGWSRPGSIETLGSTVVESSSMPGVPEEWRQGRPWSHTTALQETRAVVGWQWKTQEHHKKPRGAERHRMMLVMESHKMAEQPRGAERHRMIQGAESHKMPRGVECYRMIQGAESHKMPRGVECYRMMLVMESHTMVQQPRGAEFHTMVEGKEFHKTGLSRSTGRGVRLVASQRQPAAGGSPPLVTGPGGGSCSWERLGAAVGWQPVAGQ